MRLQARGRKWAAHCSRMWPQGTTKASRHLWPRADDSSDVLHKHCWLLFTHQWICWLPLKSCKEVDLNMWMFCVLHWRRRISQRRCLLGEFKHWGRNRETRRHIVYIVELPRKVKYMLTFPWPLSRCWATGLRTLKRPHCTSTGIGNVFIGFITKTEPVATEVCAIFTFFKYLHRDH